MNLRNLAKGRECQVRLPGICNGDPATTVLAHYRLIGISGIGMKSPDLIAAHACASCHYTVDNVKGDDVRLAHAEGVFRTQAILLKEELI